MTITDALIRSKETGETFHRSSGWVCYHLGWTYRFSAEELMADDWEPLSEEAKNYSYAYGPEGKT